MEALGLLPLMAILWVIARHEVIKRGAGEGIGLEREVLVDAQVIYPQLLGPGGGAGRLLVEEEHIGLEALGVEDAGGQAQQGMHLAFLQELAADGFASTTLEEHVIGHDDGGAAMNRQERFDVLQENGTLRCPAGASLWLSKVRQETPFTRAAGLPRLPDGLPAVLLLGAMLGARCQEPSCPPCQRGPSSLARPFGGDAHVRRWLDALGRCRWSSAALISCPNQTSGIAHYKGAEQARQGSPLADTCAARGSA